MNKFAAAIWLVGWPIATTYSEYICSRIHKHHGDIYGEFIVALFNLLTWILVAKWLARQEK